jgi:hypothetical protein
MINGDNEYVCGCPQKYYINIVFFLIFFSKSPFTSPSCFLDYKKIIKNKNIKNASRCRGSPFKK